MRPHAVTAIMGKDLREFSRDRFFMVVTVLGLVFYVGIYWFLPETVDETFTVGVAGDPAIVDALTSTSGSDGLELVVHDDAASLEAAVAEGEDVLAGLLFPDGFVEELVGGGTPSVTVFVGPALPPELEPALSAMVRELAFAASGQPLPVEPLPEDQVVVGEDRVGNQVSLQQQMEPLFAFMVLLVESITLGALIAGEIQSRTVVAVTATPASVSDFLTAKVIFGTALAFSQAMLLLLAIRALGDEPLAMAVAIGLGSVLVTGFAMISGSIGKDFISVMFWSIAFMLPLMIPAFSVLFPGSSAAWVQLMPSYPLIETILALNAYGAGWSEIAANLALLTGWCVVVVAVGWVALRRRISVL